MPRGDFAGIPLVVEHTKGTRRWAGGPILAADYGYLRRIPSAEGPSEWMDCFVGDCGDSRDVYIVDQFRDGHFDEHKVMLGFDSEGAARAAWNESYAGTPMTLGYVTKTSIGSLDAWLKGGSVVKPFHDQGSYHLGPRAVA